MSREVVINLSKRIKPVLKWAGGKRQLLEKIIPIIENKLDNSGTYFEPFFGGGAVLFFLQPSKAIINDFNQELIDMYKVIRDQPYELIEELKKHKNTKEHFYDIRNLDRKDNFIEFTKIEKAARTIYLNKTCFNGLYRVNSKGEFNVPFANNKNPLIVDQETILGISSYLKDNKIEIMNVDFEKAVKKAKKGDYIYFDPPYFPLNKTSSYTSYTKESFDLNDQIRLRDLAKKMKNKGINFAISNSDSKEIHNLYSDKEYFEVKRVEANRSINSKGNLRQAITEILIINAGKK